MILNRLILIIHSFLYYWKKRVSYAYSTFLKDIQDNALIQMLQNGFLLIINFVLKLLKRAVSHAYNILLKNIYENALI